MSWTSPISTSRRARASRSLPTARWLSSARAAGNRHRARSRAWRARRFGSPGGSRDPPLLLLVRRACARRAEEQRLPVGERQVAAIGAPATVLRLIAIDDNLGALFERLLREAAAQQRVG